MVVNSRMNGSVIAVRSDTWRQSFIFAALNQTWAGEGNASGTLAICACFDPCLEVFFSMAQVSVLRSALQSGKSLAGTAIPLMTVSDNCRIVAFVASLYLGFKESLTGHSSFQSAQEFEYAKKCLDR